MTAVKKYWKNIIFVLLLFLAAVSVFQGVKNAASYSQDFQWDAAKVIFKGMNPYDESIAPSKELLELGYDEYYKQMEANQFPSLLMLLYPYTLLSPLMARYVWIVSNLFFTLGVCVLLKKTFFKDIAAKDMAIVSLLMVASTPWRNQIGVGQHTIFSLFFFLLAVYLSEVNEKAEKKHGLILVCTGLCLAVSYFKYTLTAPLTLYFVYKRKWKELVISICPHAVLTVVASIMVNDSLPNMILKPLKVAAVLANEGSLDFGSMLMAGNGTMLIAMLLMILLIIFVIKMPVGMDNAVLSVLLLWSLVMIYHRSYDFFVMIIPFAYFIKAKECRENVTQCYLYTVLTVFIFFVLRLFNEGRPVMITAAVLYYAFLVYMTCLVVKKGMMSPDRSSNE